MRLKRAARPILPAVITVASALVVIFYVGLRGWSVPRAGNPNHQPTDAQSTPVGSMMEPIDTLPLTSESAAAHVDSLPRVLRPVTLSELTALPGQPTLRQALADLRPYWIRFTGGRFRVDVAGQLVGDDALDRILIGNVAQLRLIFAPVEPHWTLRIDFR